MGPRARRDSGELYHHSGGYHIADREVYTKDGNVRSSDVEALKCGLCLKILRDPVQLISCGCRYCNTCVQQLVASSEAGKDSFVCPFDGETFKRGQIRKDKGCLKEIQLLEVNCPSDVPCGWRGSLVDMEHHQQCECPNATVLCPKGCGHSYLLSEQHDHALQCPKREEVCQHCSATVARDQLEDHYGTCPAHPMTCDFCREMIPHRSDFKRHLEEVCPECELDCPMAKAMGCTFKGKRRELSQHSMNSHLLNVLEKVCELSLTVVAVKAENEDLRRQSKEQGKTIETLQRKVEKLEHLIPIDEVERDGGTSHSQHRGLGIMDNSSVTSIVRKSPGTLRSFPPPSSSSSSSSSPSTSSFDYHQTSSTSSNNSNSSVTSSVASSITHMLRETVEKHDNQITRLHENMQSLQQNITRYSIAVDEVRLRQDVQDVKTTHGIFIWKIPDIRRRYRDALDRKTISLYSPPFQTSPHGYRMCVRVYLNGDGAGKGTYISMFFVLMRSEHDDLLSFPFKQSVRFTLINQENRAESISEAFAPDLKSQSFQKPDSEMNVASGFPKFARQTVLQDNRFTKGNVIYIKAQVDLAGLSLE